MRIYVKGAPEYLIDDACTHTVDSEGEVTSMDAEEKHRILNSVVAEDLCKRGLRCLAFAYKDY